MELEQGLFPFAVKLAAPLAPAGLTFGAADRARHLKAAAKKGKKGLYRALKESEAFLKSIDPANPFRAKWLQDLARTRQGIKSAYRREDGVSRYDRGVEAGAADYEKYLRECRYPLYGDRKTGVKGLIFLVIMALTGDPRLANCLKPGEDEITVGAPICVCPPEKLKDFRRELRRQLAESGWIIIGDEFSLNDVAAQNEQLNRLVERYRSPEFAPFATGGVSHMDFVVREIQGQPRLGLDIKVTNRSL